MFQAIFGTVMIVFALASLIGLELVRRQPERLRSGFMYVRRKSLVLMLYSRGSREADLENLLADKSLRTKYLIERYIVSLIVFAVGLWFLSR
jgi:hypothetical protein